MAEGESGNPSTPPAADPAAPPATPAVPEPAKPAEPPKAGEPAAVEPPKESASSSDPAKPTDAALKTTEPLFTLPEDFKPPESMVTKFTETVKGKWADGKLSMTPQDVADLYVAMARDANASWQKTIEDTNRTNEAACRATFNAQELAAAETAVGWFSSFDPKFREVAKRQLNDPVFTNAMRLVGELLSEDDLGRPEAPPQAVDKRPLRVRAAEKLYGTKQ